MSGRLLLGAVAALFVVGLVGVRLNGMPDLPDPSYGGGGALGSPVGYEAVPETVATVPVDKVVPYAVPSSVPYSVPTGGGTMLTVAGCQSTVGYEQLATIEIWVDGGC